MAAVASGPSDAANPTDATSQAATSAASADGAAIGSGSGSATPRPKGLLVGHAGAGRVGESRKRCRRHTGDSSWSISCRFQGMCQGEAEQEGSSGKAAPVRHG
ncbi:unnamed protein product [Alopecurus aequalis]